MALPETNPVYGPFFGVMGAAAAIIFSGKYHCGKKIEKKKMDVGFFVQISSFLNFYILNYTFKLIFLFFLLISARSCLWNSQIRHRNCSDVSHETWVDYEINHPCGHGWYYCHLRIGRCCFDCRSTRGTRKIHSLQVSNAIFKIFIFNIESCDHPEKKNQWLFVHRVYYSGLYPI